MTAITLKSASVDLADISQLQNIKYQLNNFVTKFDNEYDLLRLGILGADLTHLQLVQFSFQKDVNEEEIPTETLETDANFSYPNPDFDDSTGVNFSNDFDLPEFLKSQCSKPILTEPTIATTNSADIN